MRLHHILSSILLVASTTALGASENFLIGGKWQSTDMMDFSSMQNNHAAKLEIEMSSQTTFNTNGTSNGLGILRTVLTEAGERRILSESEFNLEAKYQLNGNQYQETPTGCRKIVKIPIPDIDTMKMVKGLLEVMEKTICYTSYTTNGTIEKIGPDKIILNAEGESTTFERVR